MTVNEQYEAAYNNTFAEFYKTYSENRQKANDEYQARYIEEQKKRQPILKKKQKYDPLDDEFIAALRDEFTKKFNILEDEEKFKAMKDNREKLLDSLAKDVQIVPCTEMHMVKTSGTSGYQSQGYGMHTYARNALNTCDDKLKSKGLTTEVKFDLIAVCTGRYSTGDCGTYQLWVNCPKWMADAIFRTVIFKDVLKSMHGQNLRVYYPFMSPEMAEMAYAPLT